MKKVVLFLGIALFLSGCSVPQPPYVMGKYQHNLFLYYGGRLDDEEFLQTLLASEKEANEKGIPLAPGLYAEIGTLYLNKGNRKEAMAYYTKEGETWVQGKPFMDTLVQNLKKIPTEKTKDKVEGTK